MKNLLYPAAVELEAAQTKIDRAPRLRATRLEDDVIRVSDYNGWYVWYYPNGLIGVFANSMATQGPHSIYSAPDGVSAFHWTSIDKQYLVVVGQDGVKRYYLFPKIGGYKFSDPQTVQETYALILSPHPEKGYVPIRKVPDYEIYIDRRMKKLCKEAWNDFFDYAKTMWDLLPTTVPPEVQANIRDEYLKLNQLPIKGDRKTWYVVLQYGRLHKWPLEALSINVDKAVMEQDMPYRITLVPDTRMSHTEHWSRSLLQRLGAAGRLDDLIEK